MFGFLLRVLGTPFQSWPALPAENLALRNQIAVRMFTLTSSDHGAQSHGSKDLHLATFLITICHLNRTVRFNGCDSRAI